MNRRTFLQALLASGTASNAVRATPVLERWSGHRRPGLMGTHFAGLPRSAFTMTHLTPDGFSLDSLEPLMVRFEQSRKLVI